jgi:hypothetical protein
MMISPERETEIVVAAQACGAEILELISHRPTGRARDIADLAYAYHAALILLLRDSEVTNEERLAVLRIVDRVQDLARAYSASVLEKHGRWREIDA